MTVTKEAVLDRLKTVNGPDFTGNIVDLGLVSDIFIADGKVFFSITVPAARAQEMEPLRAAAERVVKAIPGVAGAMVALTAEKKGGGMEAPVQPRPSAARPLHPPLRLGRRPPARPPHAPCSGLALVGQARRAGHRLDHRRRVRQGRRRQVHHRRQHRARARRQWAEGRRARRRHLRPVHAEAAEHPRQAADGRRQDPEADGELRPEGHVDGLPRRRGDADDLARADGHVGAVADAARGRVGRTRRARRRHAARHRRRAADHGAAGAACRRGHRLDAAGSGADRRAQGPEHVQEGRRAAVGHRREHELFHRARHRQALRHLRPWRREDARPSGSA